MRWLALALLGACSFSPGTFSAGGGDDVGGGDDASVDVPGATPDSDVDGMVVQGPPFTRLIDIVDAKVTGTHTDFPLLVAIQADWLKSIANGGTVARDDGFVVHFSADQAGSTPLVYERERYNEMTGVLIAWVKIPSFSAATTLYVHYGDTALTTDPTQPTQVWTNGFASVLHLAGGADASGNTAPTGDGLNGVAGQIGVGRELDGSTSYINLTSNTIVDDVFAAGATLEAWIKPASAGENDFGRVFDKNQWAFYTDDDNANDTISFFHEGGGSSIGTWVGAAGSITYNVWQHVAVTYNKDAAANDPTIYVNGTSIALTQLDTPTGTMDSDASDTLYAGNRSDGARTFNGVMDELRISTGTRSDGWITTEVANQSDPSAFYTISDPL
jgi:hypothetical protein